MLDTGHFEAKGNITTRKRLTSTLPDGGLSPLQVLSKVLNVNLNAEFLGGYRVSQLAIKANNETITGNYTFVNAPSISTPSTSPSAAVRYDQLTGGYVPITRQIIPGTGIAGGGALSANVTVSLDLTYTDARYAAAGSTPSEVATTDFHGHTGFKWLRGAGAITTNQPSASNWGAGFQVSTNNDPNHINLLLFDINGGLYTQTKYITWGAWDQIATHGHVSATYVPLTRSLTINGTAGQITSSAGAQTLAADRTVTLALASSGVSAGTGTKFVVDTYGRITSRVSATTLADYGITDAVGSSSVAGTINYVPMFTSSSAIGNSPMSVSGGVVTSTGKIIGDTIESNAAAHATNITGFRLTNGSSARWGIGKRGTEPGGNVGSDLWIFSFDDSGNYLSNPIVITRSTGNISFAGVLTVATGNTSTQWNSAYAAMHNAVTLGTANGLSLSTQVLSLQLATSGQPGALSAADWSTFNSKQPALSGSGLVKSASGTISYITDNSSNWNTAYGYGPHSGLYFPVEVSVSDFQSQTGFKFLKASNGSPSNGPGGWANGFQVSTNNDPNHINQLLVDINGTWYTQTKYTTWGAIYTFVTTQNQATLTRGTGLTGSNFNATSAATFSVDFGTGTNQASRGDHTHANLTAGTGLSGSTYNGANAYTWSVNFGTSAGTVAQGDDSRINNGQTAFGWGNHASPGYITAASSNNLTNKTGNISQWTNDLNYLSGAGTGGYFMKYSSGLVATNSTVQDTGSEVNFASSRDFGVEGHAAFRKELHIHEYVEIGKSGYHGTALIFETPGSGIHASLMFELRSTTKGSLAAPEMTCAQKTAISSPKVGAKVFQTDAGTTSAGTSGYGSSTTGAGYYWFNGFGWVREAYV